MQTFIQTLKSRVFNLKEIDAKLIALRYKESGMGHSVAGDAQGDLNYKKFIYDV